MRHIVYRSGGKADVRDGAREDVKVGQDRRRKEGQIQLDPAPEKRIASMGRAEAVRRLAHRGHVTGISAHEAHGMAVDPDQPCNRLRFTGPVHKIRSGKVVGF